MIASIARTGVIRTHSREVFDFDDLGTMLTRGDDVFARMPDPGDEPSNSTDPSGALRVETAPYPAAEQGEGRDLDQIPPSIAGRPDCGVAQVAPLPGGDLTENRRLQAGALHVNVVLDSGE